jgi:SH3-like domain-containing protein
VFHTAPAKEFSPVPFALPFPIRNFLLQITAFVILSLAFFATHASAQNFVSVKVSSANVRELPNARAAVLWELGSGYPLQIQQRKGAWLKVRDHEATLGWIHNSITGASPHRIVTARTANLRSGPGENHRSLGKLERDEVLRTLAKNGQWVQVQREGGQKGWVARRLTWGW